jgi:hypothetical protein
MIITRIWLYDGAEGFGAALFDQFLSLLTISDTLLCK